MRKENLMRKLKSTIIKTYINASIGNIDLVLWNEYKTIKKKLKTKNLWKVQYDFLYNNARGKELNYGDLRNL
jgi:hypothetical protein